MSGWLDRFGLLAKGAQCLFQPFVEGVQFGEYLLVSLVQLLVNIVGDWFVHHGWRKLKAGSAAGASLVLCHPNSKSCQNTKHYSPIGDS